jgi:hypothetical protein
MKHYLMERVLRNEDGTQRGFLAMASFNTLPECFVYLDTHQDGYSYRVYDNFKDEDVSEAVLREMFASAPKPVADTRKVHYNQFTSTEDGKRHVEGFVKELHGNAHKQYAVKDSERHLATGDPESVTCSRCLKHGYIYGF